MRSRTWSVALLALLALAACKKKAAEVADAGEAPAAVADTPDANSNDPATTNAANVARFGDEVKIDHVAAVVVSGNAQVREDPAGGKLFATIPKGASVTELAEHEGHVLVVFDNPKTPTEKLSGWVSKDVFSASAVVRVAAKDGGVATGDAGAAGTAAKVDAGAPKAAGLKTGIAK